MGSVFSAETSAPAPAQTGKRKRRRSSTKSRKRQRVGSFSESAEVLAENVPSIETSSPSSPPSEPLVPSPSAPLSPPSFTEIALTQIENSTVTQNASNSTANVIDSPLLPDSFSSCDHDIKNENEITLQNTNEQSTEQENKEQKLQTQENPIQLHFSNQTPPYVLYKDNDYNPSNVENATYQKFLKGAKWSPDGTCLLTNAEDKHVRLYETPRELFAWQQPATIQSMAPVFSIPHSEVVYDISWYPLMNSADPNSSMFITTSKDNPLHMWDAFTGKIRCSYSAYDHLDELTSAISLCFNAPGDKIITGYNKHIRIFDTNRPGRECTSIPTVHKDHKGPKMGQFGLISCFAANPDPSYHDLFVAGSYSSTIGLYSDKDPRVIDVIHGHQTGITNLQFSPSGSYLFSGSRKENQIFCWDMRSYSSPVATFTRECTNNQRIYFDIHPSGSHLITGSQDGKIIVYDLQSFEKLVEYQGHSSSCNAVSFHPFLPYFASASGERVFCFEGEEQDEQDRKKAESELDIWAIPFYSNSFQNTTTTI